MATHREIFNNALPSLLAILLNYLIQATDALIATQLGTQALAAMAFGGGIIFLPLTLSFGLMTTTQKAVSIHDTEASKTERDLALSSNLLLAFLIGALFSIVLYFLADTFAGWFATGETKVLTVQYLKIYAPSFIFLCLGQVLMGYRVGGLANKERLFISIFAVTLNVIGSLALVKVLGFAGIILASVIAIVLGFILSFYLFVKKSKFSWQTPTVSNLLADLKLSSSISFQQVSLSFILNISTYIISMIGESEVAISKIVGTLSVPSLYLGITYGSASGTFLIKALHKNDIKTAKLIFLRVLLQISLINGVLGLGFLLFKDQIAPHFFIEPETLKLAMEPLMLIPILFLFEGIITALQRFNFVSDLINKGFIIGNVIPYFLFLPLTYLAARFGNLTYFDFLILYIIHRLLIIFGFLIMWNKKFKN